MGPLAFIKMRLANKQSRYAVSKTYFKSIFASRIPDEIVKRYTNVVLKTR